MQGIEFEEEKSFNTPPIVHSKEPTGRPSLILGLLIKIGVSDRTTANIILLGIALVFFGITIFLYAGILGNSMPSKQSADQIAVQARALREMPGIK